MGMHDLRQAHHLEHRSRSSRVSPEIHIRSGTVHGHQAKLRECFKYDTIGRQSFEANLLANLLVVSYSL